MAWKVRRCCSPSEAAGLRNQVLQGPFQCYTNQPGRPGSSKTQIMKRNKLRTAFQVTNHTSNLASLVLVEFTHLGQSCGLPPLEEGRWGLKGRVR